MLNPALIVRRRRTSGAVAVAPAEVWPPTVTPDMYFDFDLGEGYWGGAAKTLSDFIDDGGGTYRIIWDDMGFPEETDYTLMAEVYYDGSGTLDATSKYDLIAVRRSTTDYTTIRGFATNGGWAQAGPIGSGASMGTGPARGRTRLILSRETGADTNYSSSYGVLYAAGVTNTGGDHIPLGYSRCLYINQDPNTDYVSAGTANTSGLELKRIALWGHAITLTEMFTTARFEKPGIYISGDSFVANGSIRERFIADLEGRGREHIAVFEDGVGAVGLTEHVIRHTANSEAHGDSLFIVDGGFEVDDGIAAAKTAIDTYVSNLGHDRWALVEPNPLNVLGDTRRDDWNDFFYGHAGNTGARELYDYVGAEHYIKTYDAMQAANDGSPEDLSDIASGLWPRSVTSDGTHPNTVGEPVLAGLMADYAVAKNWV